MNKFGKILGSVIMSFAGLLLLASLLVITLSAIRTGNISNPGRINLVRGIGPIGLLVGGFMFFHSLLIAGIGMITLTIAKLNEAKPIPPELPLPLRKK
jgi:hypothetical protein